MQRRAMNFFRRLREGPLRSHYLEQGYCVLRDVLPRVDVERLAERARTLLPSYDGEYLRQSGRREVNDFFPGTRLIRNSPAALHLGLTPDLQPVCDALRTLVTSPVLADRLREIDEAGHYHINQTLLFFAAQTTALHIDSWAVDTVPRGAAHTLWIPLQELDHRSGIPAIVPWPVGKVVSEQELGLDMSAPHGERYERYHRALSDRLLDGSPDLVAPLAQPSDVVVWSCLTPHLTLPAQPFPKERLSIQVLVRPAHLNWGNFTVQPESYPTTHVVRATDRFSYFVPREIHQEFRIGEAWNALQVIR
jgi:hypothetical protein